MKIRHCCMLCCLMLTVFIGGCNNPVEEGNDEEKLKIGMVLDTGGDKDHGFNEYSLKGAREAAHEQNIEFTYLASGSTTVFERNIDKVIAEGADLIFTVGFQLANSTAKAAIRYPDRKFVIMDYGFFPGRGCPETVKDCYTEEGGLANVTSLLFKEDQPSYLAGVLAACMSKTGVIGSVAGYEIPPVVRFVEGFEKGARSVNPTIETYRRYIPDFNDPSTGYVVAMDFLSKGVDVLLCAGGNTGLGGLRAAKETNTMAVGVDVDQYLTFPEAGSALITSVMKNVDVAARIVVEQFAAGTLKPGIQSFDLHNSAVGLAPFHGWADRVPEKCVAAIEEAQASLMKYPELSLPDRQK